MGGHAVCELLHCDCALNAQIKPHTKKRLKRYNNSSGVFLIRAHFDETVPFKAPRLAEKLRDADDSATLGVLLVLVLLVLGAVFEREKSARRKQQRRVDEENVAGDD